MFGPDTLPTPAPTPWSEEQALNSCVALHQQQRWPQLLEQALLWCSIKPQAVKCKYYAASAYRHLGELGEALAFYSSALEAYPYCFESRLERAGIYQDMGQLPRAQEDFQWCNLLRPRNLEVLRRLHHLLAAQDKWAQVSELLGNWARLAPDTPGLALSSATAFLHQRLMEQAAPFFEQALQETNNSAAVKWEYAMQLLMMEDFARGWDFHEARFEVFGWQALNTMPLTLPRWQGEPLQGKTILVHGEQGTGDEVMFASVVPQLVEQAKLVVLACHPNLVDLFQTSFPAATVIPHPRGNPSHWEKSLPDWFKRLIKKASVDYQTPSSSLAQFTRRRAEDFPGKPYLKVTPERKARAGLLLATEIARHTATEAPFVSAPGAGLKIGLAWSGNLSNPTAALRSTPLATLAPLRDALPGATFVSLQSTQYAHQIAEVPSMRLVDTSADTANFADLAAMMQHLDLVITVDTSYVHIAAGLGVPTWLMQSRRGEWRWGWQRKHPLWYHCVQLFWQPSQGDWASVIRAMADELQVRWASKSLKR